MLYAPWILVPLCDGCGTCVVYAMSHIAANVYSAQSCVLVLDWQMNAFRTTSVDHPGP